jgi:DNA-binding CsgD family transcriptional regulator
MTDYSARNRKIVARVAAGATLQEVADEYGLTKQMISYVHRRTTGRLLLPHRPKWPEDRVRTLRVLWRKGLPCAAIAQRLGVSKNAVIGKAHRLGLLPERRR